LGFNKYSISSKTKEGKSGLISEFETGGMSQKQHQDQIISEFRISKQSGFNNWEKESMGSLKDLFN
jgi:hypothetical protein